MSNPIECVQRPICPVLCHWLAAHPRGHYCLCYWPLQCDCYMCSGLCSETESEFGWKALQVILDTWKLKQMVKLGRYTWGVLPAESVR